MREVTDVQAQWIFTQDALEHTPSRRAGVSLEDELRRRKLTVDFIRSLVLRSGLGIETPENNRARGVITVAATLVHRFYMRRSLTDFSEMLMAPTILFLASKIEEEPIKLRFIVNACLAKWDSPSAQWHVDPNNKDQHPKQTPQYQAWEREILVAEELALDALCFNMDIEQPWAVLKRGTAGMKPMGSITEAKVAQAGFSIINEALSTPLVVLHHPDIIGFSTLVLIVAFVQQIPISQGKVLAAERAGSFQLDFKAADGVVTGADTPDVQAFCNQFIEYCKMGLIDEALLRFVQPEPVTNGSSVPQTTPPEASVPPAAPPAPQTAPVDPATEGSTAPITNGHGTDTPTPA